MAKRGKFFELLDIPKFAEPDVLKLDPAKTAVSVAERLAGSGFMSYGQIWPRMPLLIGGLATDALIDAWFSAYKDGWKNQSIREASRLLRELLGAKGRWYPAPLISQFVLGVGFRPSIKGYWFYEGKAYAVLINARKGQPLSADDVPFLARGVYELHCIDDPNDPIPLIIDLSEPIKGEGRKARSFVVEAHEAIPYEAFESTVRRFMEALHMAGVALPVPTSGEIVDLFRRR